MATLIYRRTMQVHMDKLSEAMEIATEQAKIFKELTGNDELVSFQIGGNPRTICRQRMVEMVRMHKANDRYGYLPEKSCWSLCKWKTNGYS